MPRNRNGEPVSINIPALTPIATTRDPGSVVRGTATEQAQRAPRYYERTGMQIMEDLLLPPAYIDHSSPIRNERVLASPRFPGTQTNTVAPPANGPISPRQHREGMGGRPEPVISTPPPPPQSIHPSTFASVPLSDQQAGDIAEIGLAAGAFAREIDRLIPGFDVKPRIMDQLREIVFWAKETIARFPDGTPRYDPFLDCQTAPAGATVIPEPVAPTRLRVRTNEGVGTQSPRAG